RYSGPFRFIPLVVQETRCIALNQPGAVMSIPGAQPAESLMLSFQIWTEPRLPLLGVGAAKLEAAYDSDKNCMVPTNTGGTPMMDFRFGPRQWVSRFGNGNRTLQMQTEVALMRPSIKASSIRLVRASLPVTLLVEQKPVVVADKIMSAKGRKVTVGTTTFHFDDVSTLAAKQYQIKLSVSE